MPPQTIDIAYLYEKAPRELDVACIIKSILQDKHGLRVEIFQQNYQPEVTVSRYKPRVVVLPYCYQEQSHSTYYLRWRKSVYFNLTWEQLFYSGNATAKTPRGDFALNHCIHHAWSEDYANFLRKLGVADSRIVVNGNPAYMLYREPYRRYFKDRAALAWQHGLNPDKRWIFFPENYNWAFYSENDLHRFVRAGQSMDDLLNLQHFCRRSLAETMRWLQQALKQSDVEIIVRPRPSTLLTDFTQAVKDALGVIPTGLLITQDATVREWILASDIVASSYSTSIIEAALADKPVYLLEPFPIPDSLVTNWQSLAPHVNSLDEFLKIVRADSLDDTGNRIRAWVNATLLTHGDAIFNIAENLARLCRGEAPRPAIPSPKSVTYAGRRSLPWWLVRAYRQLRLRYFALFPQNITDVEHELDIRALDSIPVRLRQWSDVLRKTAT